ncbi:MAG: MATE family efflux transporter [Paludibacter sp.]|nr:MATE family efflux transporter [Paludibacter sp.]
MNSTSNILKITYPIFLTLLAQNLINIVDTAFLGRVSEVALGASAIAGVYFFALYVVGFGFSQGAQILIGRRNGEGNYNQIGPVFNNGMVFIVLLALLFLIVGLLLNSVAMKIMVSSPAIYEGAMEYLDWRVYGFLFGFINAMYRAFYVGITQTKVLTISAIITTISNIVLDYCFIFGHFGFPKMGIAGAALASVIAEALATVYLFNYTLGNKEFKKYNLFQKLKVDFIAIKQILNLSVFIMFQFFISISTWFLFFLFIERMGERPLAITNIGRSMYILLMIPAHALSTTAGTLVSNMIGAGLTEQVLKTTHKIMKIAILTVAPFLVFTFIFPSLFAHIYTDDAALMLASLPVIKVVAVAVAFFTLGNIIVNAVSGTGNTKTALAIEIVTLFFYISYVYLTAIVFPQPVHIVWMSEFVYWSIISMLGYLYLRKGKWREKQI